MKRLRYFGCLIVALCMALPVAAQSYDALWKQIKLYQLEELPRSVISTADKIIFKAEQDGEMGCLLKGMVIRAEYVHEITPDSLIFEIERFEALKARVTDKTDKAMCASVISHLYLKSRRYYPQARAAAIESVACKDDIAGASALRYSPLIEEGTSGEYYNHSLYKLLTDRAIDCLKRCDASPSASVDSLYSELISLCLSDSKMADGALLSTLDRLKYQRNTRRDVSTKDATEQYATALDSLISACSNLQTCAEAIHARAELYRANGDNRKAVALCNDGIERYNKYNRINILKELRRSITAPSLSIGCAPLYYPNEQCAVKVSYNNVESVMLSVSSNGKTISTSTVALKPSDNYQQQDTTVYLSLDTPGKYEINASTADIKANKQSINVSQLRLLYLSLPGNKTEFVVVGGKSGKPIKGAKLKIMDRKNNVLKTLTTDIEGKVIVEWNTDYHSAKAEVAGDNYLPATDIHHTYLTYYSNASTKEVERVRLLTDRAIYRPGQKVLVKGVAYRRSPGSAKIIDKRSYTVVLYDANHQKIEEQQVTTNDFGSFSTTFALPSSCLNGTFTLRTDGGSTTIRVEEYKRPTFDVTIEAPKGSYRTGDSIEITASAQMLNGVSLAGAQVEYRVNREVHHWWRRYSSNATTISSGTTTTDSDGRFTIKTQLKPERPGDEKGYCYTIEATVTSAAGESQSASYWMYAGNRSFLLTIKADELICRDDSAVIAFIAINGKGKPVNITGDYTLYRIEKDTIMQAHGENVDMNGTINIKDEWRGIDSGRYLLRISTKDENGRPASAKATFTLFSESDKRPPVEMKEWYREGNLQFDANHPATFSYGTSEKNAYVMVRMLSRDKLIDSKLITLTDTIIRYEIPYRKEYGDGVNMLFTFVKDGKMYSRTVKMTRRLPERELKMSWSTFRDRLTPGNTERWSLTIKRADGTNADAELAAMMYDASLDRLWSRHQSLYMGYSLYVPCSSWQLNWLYPQSISFNFPAQSIKYPNLLFDSLYDAGEYIDKLTIRGGRPTLMYASAKTAVGANVQSRTVAGSYDEAAKEEAAKEEAAKEEAADMEPDDAGEDIESDSNVRTDLAETALFYPQLRTDSKGTVNIEFTVPESLTEWRFNGYAHTRDMNYGLLTSLVKTQKELMVIPNMPRFVRTSDHTSIAASIVNMSEQSVEGTATMTLFDPYTEKVISKTSNRFAASAGETTTVSFEFDVPADKEIIGCRIVADAGSFSDGEQRLLPVLSDKMHLIETLAMSVGKGDKVDFSTGQLFNNQSNSATNRKVTVELTGNSAWSAVQALPSLAKSEGNDAFTWAIVYYANSLSKYIAKSNPQIKTTVESWSNDASATDNLRSALQNNEELKGVLLNETPWVLDAQSETEQRERIVELFNGRNISNSIATAQRKLKNLQLNDGSWPWFKGMDGSFTVTSFIAELNARLAMLKDEELTRDIKKMQTAAIDYLHSEMQIAYGTMTEEERSEYSLSHSALRYLYIVAISGEAVKPVYSNSYQFYLSKVGATLQSNDMQTMALAAVIEQKAGKPSAARKFINSMREHLSTDNDGALSFAFNERAGSFDFRQLPTHVKAMEAFDIVSSDTATVEKMKLWLLQRKRNQSWNSNVTTADAVYGLLMRGGDWLSVPTNVSATLGGHTLSTATYAKESFSDSSAIKAKSITLKNGGGNMAWGALFAESDEEIDKVKSVETAGVTVKREFICDSLRIGAKVTVRTTITIPSRMDFVMLKIDHAACMEPTATLSGYCWNGIVGYYHETKDASTCLYFDSIGKGEFVIETKYRLSRSGEYQSGISTVKSLYSPEYSAHSDSKRIIIAD